MIGKVAKCKHGKIGVITRVGIKSCSDYYYGIAFDGTSWESKDPVILADNINEYIEHLSLVEQFEELRDEFHNKLKGYKYMKYNMSWTEKDIRDDNEDRDSRIRQGEYE